MNEPLINCSRCGCEADPDNRWENRWPLRGLIDLGFSAQAFGALCGMEYIAESHHFDWWKEGHPAMKINNAQRVVFEWKYDGSFRLCYQYQTELIS